PVIVFVYERYWHKISNTQEVTENATPSPTATPSADIDLTENALAALKELREAVGKLPTIAEKPKLDAKDARKLTELADIRHGQLTTIGNFVFSLSNE